MTRADLAAPIGVQNASLLLPSTEKASKTFIPLLPVCDAPLKPDMLKIIAPAMVGPIPSMPPPG